MNHNRRGRPRGRPTKEWTEYVPKGIDPKDNREGDSKDYRAEDSYREHPTEDKPDNKFNKRPSKPDGGQKGPRRPQNERQRQDNLSDMSDEYTEKHYPSNEGRKETEKRSYQNNGLMAYKKKDKRPAKNDDHDEENDGEREDRERRTYQWRECVVCLLKCSPTSTVWNCYECRITCHLKCIKDWVCKQNNIERYDPKVVDKSKTYTWNCPHCQTAHKGTIPSYYCFCGKTKNPKQDIFLEPHSCGLKCEKKKGGLCIHPCSEACHSGVCPPCDILVPQVDCFCGKETTDRVCGELNKRTCGQACNRLLNCKIHKCDKICHEGDCPPCPVLVEASCHCGKTTESRRCGEEFSCGMVCNRQLDCEVHRCKSICHEGPCQNCELFPYDNEKCFCGKKLESDILGHPRDGCHEDRQPCGAVCSKALVCGHKCVLKCHQGECECGNEIEKLCRCGHETFKIKCHKRFDDMLCDRICKKKKSCKVHRCEIACCISVANSLEHTCMEFCGRMLECGRHPCPKKCHTGKCGECTIMVNQTLRCACGSKVIPAPVKCGTEIPYCNKKCGKQLSCGHYCYYNCHFGDCKPCQEIVDKPCACGKKVIEKGVCSIKMFCQNVCKHKLKCGHECGQNCHSEDCLELLQKRKADMASQGLEISEKGCLHSCGKKRAACGHPCEVLCHPEDPVCPLEPCKYIVKVTCKCGNRTKFVECGCTDKKMTKELPCEDRCLNLQRFKSLYEKTAHKIYYPGFLVKFAKNHYPYLKKLEVKLQELLLGSEGRMVITVDKNSSDKMKALLTLLPKHYMLDVLIFKSPKNNLLTLGKTPESIIPQMVLSTYFEKISKGDVDVDQTPFDAKIRFFDLSFYENIQELDKILAEVKDDYYAELDRNNKVKLYVWNRESIPGITKRLQKSGTGFSQFEVDEYKDKSEEEVDEEVLITEEQSTALQTTDAPLEMVAEDSKPKFMVEEIGANDDSEDEKGLDHPLSREISVEETKILQAATKERKNSTLSEKGNDQPSEN